MKKTLRNILCLVMLMIIYSHVAMAQKTAQVAEQPLGAASVESAENATDDDTPKELKKFDSESFPSVLFTFWEQVSIEDARRSDGLRRAPTDAELESVLNTDQDVEKVKPPPEKRNITLSGIAYHGSKNWTIWLNGQRVTPDAIPPEAQDLKVFKEYIEIKWFDDYTNRIIPIRLRPHQRFNIDTRIFLPG